MDKALHDIDREKQLLMYKLIHQQIVFEQMVLIYKENGVKPIFVKQQLETELKGTGYILIISKIRNTYLKWNCKTSDKTIRKS
jgi:hypothetical protein